MIKWIVTFANGKSIEVAATHDYKAVAKARRLLSVLYSVDATVKAA